MGIRLKDALKAFTAAIPLAAYRRFSDKKLFGFEYHIVSEEPLPHITGIYSCKTPEMFEADLVYLKKHFDLLSYERLKDPASSAPGSSRAEAFITFDDGYSQSFDIARPLLLKHKIPCMFFVTTGLIDNKEMFYRNKVSLCAGAVNKLDTDSAAALIHKINHTFGKTLEDAAEFLEWVYGLSCKESDIIDKVCAPCGIDIKGYLDIHKPYLTTRQIKTLVSDGFTIGSHGKSHCDLSILNSEEVEEEIAGSARAIMELIGQKEVPFSFPFSGRGVDTGLLDRIRSRNNFLGIFFDSKGLSENAGFIMNRIRADHPAASAAESNIPYIMKNLYRQKLLNAMHQVKKGNRR